MNDTKQGIFIANLSCIVKLPMELNNFCFNSNKHIILFLDETQALSDIFIILKIIAISSTAKLARPYLFPYTLEQYSNVTKNALQKFWV